MSTSSTVEGGGGGQGQHQQPARKEGKRAGVVDVADLELLDDDDDAKDKAKASNPFAKAAAAVGVEKAGADTGAAGQAAVEEEPSWLSAASNSLTEIDDNGVATQAEEKAVAAAFAVDAAIPLHARRKRSPLSRMMHGL